MMMHPRCARWSTCGADAATRTTAVAATAGAAARSSGCALRCPPMQQRAHRALRVRDRSPLSRAARFSGLRCGLEGAYRVRERLPPSVLRRAERSGGVRWCELRTQMV